MIFASDIIEEDIKEILPKQEAITVNEDAPLVLTANKVNQNNNAEDSEQLFISDKCEKNQLIMTSFKTEYDKWAAAEVASVTTSFYSNQIIYNEQGIAAWVCKCCEYLRMKIGDGYSSLFKQPFREG